MGQFGKRLAIATLVAAVLVPVASDAQARRGGAPWCGGSRGGHPGHGGGANGWQRGMTPWNNPWGGSNNPWAAMQDPLNGMDPWGEGGGMDPWDNPNRWNASYNRWNDSPWGGGMDPWDNPWSEPTW